MDTNDELRVAVHQLTAMLIDMQAKMALMMLKTDVTIEPWELAAGRQTVAKLALEGIPEDHLLLKFSTAMRSIRAEYEAAVQDGETYKAGLEQRVLRLVPKDE